MYGKDKLILLISKEDFEKLVVENIIPRIITQCYSEELELLEMDCHSSESNPNGDYRLVVRPRSEPVEGRP